MCAPSDCMIATIFLKKLIWGYSVWKNFKKCWGKRCGFPKLHHSSYFNPLWIISVIAVSRSIYFCLNRSADFIKQVISQPIASDCDTNITMFYHFLGKKELGTNSQLVLFSIKYEQQWNRKQENGFHRTEYELGRIASTIGSS